MLKFAGFESVEVMPSATSVFGNIRRSFNAVMDFSKLLLPDLPMYRMTVRWLDR